MGVILLDECEGRLTKEEKHVRWRGRQKDFLQYFCYFGDDKTKVIYKIEYPTFSFSAIFAVSDKNALCLNTSNT